MNYWRCDCVCKKKSNTKEKEIIPALTCDDMIVEAFEKEKKKKIKSYANIIRPGVRNPPGVL